MGLDGPFGEHICLAFQLSILVDDFQRTEQVIGRIVCIGQTVCTVIDETVFCRKAVIEAVQFRLLCVWGATSVERSREAWPILDEAIQCYHGDLEYRDMLGCLYEFCQGEIDAEVAEKLALRLKFDAENGKGSYLKARSSEICEMLVKRFGLDLSKKKKRASVKKSDDAEDEE